MLKLLKKVTISAVLVVATSTIYPALGVAADSYQKDKLSGAEQHPLSFKNEKQLVLADQDSQKRAVDAHIQLNYAEEPTAKQATKLNYDPVGWHNYKFKYKKANASIGKSQLFNRGHLIGYQFSGLNDEAKNLVPETAYLNTGALKKSNASNKKAMLYYERGLTKWLKHHKSSRLDYQVTPMYSGNELLPRQIRLSYIGYSNSGEKVKISLKSYREEDGNGGATVVYLNNDSSNAIINYADGTAKNTLHKKADLAAQKEAAEEASVSQAAAASSQAAANSAAAASAAQAQAAQNQSAATQTYTGESQQIIGNSKSHIYHVPGQAGYYMNSSNAVYFNSEADAQAAGYRKSLR
ncbi:DNA/RNA non-specific endonuclease [Leuconostoc mesenteroides]|uniref:DNA/RNA non-specific endonuclease n=1 Tax=Leuconostoc mesenteroides TaxID=1245 RepID=UPI000A06931B|nr:DNA/RNA non-specific endonuclease [Leuconostoc mesenteroides]ORI48467.1 DNA-entry nuclease [Leuconostoc mesenteroides subsp. cremoris]ORI49457.1 DNA-entry nuclease [Leuconostoc mesenteroides subsp. cremoris]ORI51248.1 DNA-entry nuclease [Leuconostoc mesenteroides subsp. cremoris]ORI59119.1 DNA-entry nuclease [Leuconostoc mesenteroides subsp. cremoris]ORI60713.1 DNA-entry nuclease [Leuconostoc mesenteroides subsp. cremoris]